MWYKMDMSEEDMNPKNCNNQYSMHLVELNKNIIRDIENKKLTNKEGKSLNALTYKLATEFAKNCKCGNKHK